MNNPCFTVCGIVAIQGKILLVRHTYGIAKGRILLPGGYVREGELPDRAVEREIWEETRITARAKAVLSLQFKPEQWCVAFLMEEASGTPISDGYENSEVASAHRPGGGGAGRHHQPEPGNPDGLSPRQSPIGAERLSSGGSKERELRPVRRVTVCVKGGEGLWPSPPFHILIFSFSSRFC